MLEGQSQTHPVTLVAIVIIAILLASPGLWAAEAAPVCEDPKLSSRAPASAPDEAAEGEPEVTVIQMHKNAPVERLRSRRVKVIPIDEVVEIDPWEMPDPDLRDRIFGETGITPDIARWDNLDRDLLFLRAQWKPAAKLAREYPRLSAEKLDRLVRQIQREKNGARE